MHSLKKQFLTTLHNIFRSYPQGISEYALINHLKDMQHPLFAQANLSYTLSLFRTHFVLFHALYLLRDRLHSRSEFDLQISPLQIRLVSLHHPDRGGCTQRLQRINQTMDTLRAEHLLS